MGISAKRARVVVAVVVAAAVVAGCGDGPPDRYASVEDLFAAAGGEEWCRGELRVTLAPAVGNCGPDEDRVVLGAAYEQHVELLDSVGRARDDELAVLVPVDLGSGDPWFQLRALEVGRLEEARAAIGGEVLVGDGDIDDWLARNGG